MESDLISSLLDTFDKLSGGVHPGFRPVHAKGVMCSGSFQASPDAAKRTRAAHALRRSTPITVRFSLAAGMPTVPDNDPTGASPQGIAVRLPRVDGIDSAGDPLTDVRSEIYLLSGRRRRVAVTK